MVWHGDRPLKFSSSERVRSSTAAADGFVLLRGREFLLGSGVFGRDCCMLRGPFDGAFRVIGSIYVLIRSDFEGE